mmetsp:Transcript_26639/g.57986  ORF Transcript_26639/g.57986 Transcript_26639/m.57986 type:complete len:477 (-) Transcript_26639:107-1537(-)
MLSATRAGRRLVAALPLLHASVAGHDVARLLEAEPHRLLHVGDAVPLARLLHPGHGLLVAEHGHVREHMVLDLVVEPPVHEVVRVAQGPGGGALLLHVGGGVGGAEVHRPDHRAQVELVRLGEHLRLEAVDVVAAVVGGDGDEGVHVGGDLRRHHVGQRDGAHGGAAQQVEGQGHQHKVVHHVGQHHRQNRHEGGRVAREELAEDEGHGGGLRAGVVGLGDVGVLGVGLTALHLAVVHLLQRVGHVVEPLPDRHQPHRLGVLKDLGHLLVLAEGGEVTLDEVGVAELAELVVVEVVVLHVPRLGQHPVQPVHRARDEPLAEGGAVEAFAHLLAVVPAVGHVVAHHGPAGEDAGGEEEGGDGVAGHGVAHAAQGEAGEVAHIGPEEHLLQVLHVLLALLLLELTLEGTHLSAPGLEVEVLAPLSGVRGLGAPLGLRSGGHGGRHRSVDANHLGLGGSAHAHARTPQGIVGGLESREA